MAGKNESRRVQINCNLKCGSIEYSNGTVLDESKKPFTDDIEHEISVKSKHVTLLPPAEVKEADDTEILDADKKAADAEALAAKEAEEAPANENNKEAEEAPAIDEQTIVNEGTADGEESTTDGEELPKKKLLKKNTNK